VRHAPAQLSLALSGRRVLAPATVLLFAVIGVYAYRPNGVQESFAVTALLSALFCPWLVAAVEREVGPTAAAVLTVVAGGAVPGWRGRLVLVGIVTTAVTLVFLVWPTATDVFDRSPGTVDLLAALLAHVACGAFGGTLALLFAAPVRVASAFGAILGVIVLSIASATPVGALAGPGGIANAIGSSPPNTITAGLAAACAVTLLEASAVAVATRSLARWRG
jgi:hypothetical protein